jgi:4-amino-4-deoxy-L-arabinose transferase and related glycosyltransferases of PMT family
MSIVCCGGHTVNAMGQDETAPAYDAIWPLQDCRKRAIMRSVRELVRQKAAFFFGASLAALSLRLLLVWRFPAVVDDSRLYADIARNWLQHGIYGITNSGVIVPTLSRLPGYPAFLAGIFAVFGPDNFRAVLLVQVLFDLATCFLIADMARRLFSGRAAQASFLLAALCPFLANYAAAALTETLEVFFTALALDLVLHGLNIRSTRTHPHLTWLGCGLSIGLAILLRPDGGILLAAVGLYLLWLLVKSLRPMHEGMAARIPPAQSIILAGVLVAVGALAPLVPWTLRNLRTLHKFEPLAPRYATDSDEPVMTGFNRWVKTWIADYVSVQEIYWAVPGSEMDITRLPNRAFDSPEQRKQTEYLLSAYDESHEMSPELDSQFATLAADRIRAAPLRYYVWLPAVRIADMWVRPRTELFPSDPRWWEFNDDHRWLAVSLAFGAINLVYASLFLAGALRSRAIFGFGLFVLFLLLRSAFLGTLENPEPRYTLECYPILILGASALFHRGE